LAETGSGKTGAFAIPIIEKIIRAKSAEVPEETNMCYVVLSPTRELAQQTQRVFLELGAKAGITSVCIIGGESIERQIAEIEKGVSVLVATPGRLCDLIKRKVVNLSNCKVVVFDEADRLFDMGFQKNIEFILSKSSKERQLIMLSATSNQEVLQVAYKFNSNPEELKLNEDSLLVDHVQHKLAMISGEEKFPLLVNLLREKEDTYAIVFCNTQVQTHTVAEWLIKMGLKAAPISGRLAQNRRTKLLADFRSKQVTILVCTDVAARGLDIKEVNLVINYDLPQEAANYVHRIGRTGRAGAEGLAISFCAYEDCEYLDGIKELIETNIEQLDLEDDSFATDICKKPWIDRKTLKVMESPHKKNNKNDKPAYKAKPDKREKTVNTTTTNNTQTDKPRYERKPYEKKEFTGKRIDKRFLELKCYDIKAHMPKLLDHFRISDEGLIDHEVITQGKKKFIIFGPRENTYKFFVKPIYKRLLLPFLISIVKKAQLKLFVKVSLHSSVLHINFSGADSNLLSENNNELLRSFEQLVIVYLQSRIPLDRNLKIVVKGGNSKIERNSNSRDDKNFEARLNKLASSKRKQVLETQDDVTLKPLNARERRIIHKFFQDDKEVGTTSVGDGNLKRIKIALKA
jgi:ATP-dependent RNA helicase RhlE